MSHYIGVGERQGFWVFFLKDITCELKRKLDLNSTLGHNKEGLKIPLYWVKGRYLNIGVILANIPNSKALR